LAATIDVVVVSFNNADHIHTCVEQLVTMDEASVVVVDNASNDATVERVSELPVRVVQLCRNVGFGVASNLGWRPGAAPLVLFLNPDATIDPPHLRTLAQLALEDEHVGAIGPRLVYPDGSLQFSQHREPRLLSTFAQAFALHRVFRQSSWASEDVYDPACYSHAQNAEWLEGACLLVKRAALEQAGGFDERFFLYCEDIDLCKCLRDAGYVVRYEPTVTCVHHGQGSGPRWTSMLTESRIRFANKHSSVFSQALTRGALALRAALRLLGNDPGARREHVRSIRFAFRRIQPPGEARTRRS
jgi:N-acetylglucosaminyl-diphospho-decaprenol L-rhamnosyltransferase